MTQASSRRERRPRILLAQRGDVDTYPPVLHQSELLSGYGQVAVLDAGMPAARARFLTGGKVERVRVALDPKSGPLDKLASLQNFRRELDRQLRLQPEAVIAFEPDAAALVLRRSGSGSKFRCVIHLHEHFEPHAYAASVVSRWAVANMRKHIGRADLITLADRHRIDLLRSTLDFSCPVVVVMNCPLLLNTVPESRLIPELRSRGFMTSSIVHYQGAVGPDHGLEVVIRSMRSWPTDAVFVVVGHGNPQYIDQLRQLAAVNGGENRVCFIGRVPYDQVLSYAAGASIGVTLLDSRRDNWKFAAGASNKRFEYAAIGLPQVTNDGPGISELFTDVGIALSANADSPDDVGKKISAYLTNVELRRSAGESARQKHLTAYNYEAQYVPVLEALQLSSPRSGPRAAGAVRT